MYFIHFTYTFTNIVNSDKKHLFTLSHVDSIKGLVTCIHLISSNNWCVEQVKNKSKFGSKIRLCLKCIYWKGSMNNNIVIFALELNTVKFHLDLVILNTCVISDHLELAHFWNFTQSHLQLQHTCINQSWSPKVNSFLKSYVC